MQFQLFLFAALALLINVHASMRKHNNGPRLTRKQAKFLDLVTSTLHPFPAESMKSEFCYASLLSTDIRPMPNNHGMNSSLIDLVMMGCYDMEFGKCGRDCKRARPISKTYVLHASKPSLVKLAKKIQRAEKKADKEPSYLLKTLKGMGIVTGTGVLSLGAFLSAWYLLMVKAGNLWKIIRWGT